MEHGQPQRRAPWHSLASPRPRLGCRRRRHCTDRSRRLRRAGPPRRPPPDEGPPPGRHPAGGHHVRARAPPSTSARSPTDASSPATCAPEPSARSSRRRRSVAAWPLLRPPHRAGLGRRQPRHRGTRLGGGRQRPEPSSATPSSPGPASSTTSSSPLVRCGSPTRASTGSPIVRLTRSGHPTRSPARFVALTDAVAAEPPEHVQRQRHPRPLRRRVRAQQQPGGWPVAGRRRVGRHPPRSPSPEAHRSRAATGSSSSAGTLYNVRGSGPKDVHGRAAAARRRRAGARRGARTLTDDSLDVPSTATAAIGSLWVVNARFGVASPATACYWITRLRTV